LNQLKVNIVETNKVYKQVVHKKSVKKRLMMVNWKDKVWGYQQIKKAPQLISHRQFSSVLEKVTFSYILLIWTGTITLFGVVYHFLSGKSSYLYYTLEKRVILGLIDSIYFSFITATSTGFGDIIPIGYFKILAIFEVVIGLLLLAFVTFKLVSLKQDVILSEIYDISFNERMNRLRSSLLLFRQNLNRLITRIEEGSIRRREINEIYLYISSLDDILMEISTIYQRKGKDEYTKKVDPINTELIINSLVQSFERIMELLNILTQQKLEWKKEITINLIKRVIEVNIKIFENISNSKLLSYNVISDFNRRFNQIQESILLLIKMPEAKELERVEIIKEEQKTEKKE